MHLVEDTNHSLDLFYNIVQRCGIILFMLNTIWAWLMNWKNIQWYFTRRLYYRFRLDCNHAYLEMINHVGLESLELRRFYNDMTICI